MSATCGEPSSAKEAVTLDRQALALAWSLPQGLSNLLGRWAVSISIVGVASVAGGTTHTP
jgi:hypothetical protein